MSLDIDQKLALAKVLAEEVEATKRLELIPEALATWDEGERRSAKFAGQRVAWVGLAHGRTSVTADPRKLLPWAEKNLPSKVISVDEVLVDAPLIKFLKEHRPQSVRTTRQLDPQWVDDIKAAFKDPGYYDTLEGARLTSLPGVEVKTGDPVPNVKLEPGASAVIARAWRAGEIDLAEVLALPGSDGTVPGREQAAGTDLAAPVAFGAPGDPLFFDERGRFRSPELATYHAFHVQGGYSTPARECRRMLADARCAGDAGYEAMCTEWLAVRGLSPDGDNEPAAAPAGGS